MTAEINSTTEEQNVLALDMGSGWVKACYGTKKIRFPSLYGYREPVEGEKIDRELGASMDIINMESKKRIFSEYVINRIYLKARLAKMRTFPIYRREENSEYTKIGKKWNMKITVPRALVSKIVMDLVR